MEGDGGGRRGRPRRCDTVAHQVVGELGRFAKKYKNFLPTVEGIQDSVEKYLILNDYVKTAKGYILYRDKRAQLRATHADVPEHVKKLAEESRKYFDGNALDEFVYLRSYAKWIPEERRRETWVETVDRYMSFMRENLGDKLTEKEYSELRMSILKQEIMPSMRLMEFSGEAARRCNACGYNCTFTAPVKLEDFAEIMYLSMQGCGVGFAVESQNVEQLPQIMKQNGKKLATYVIDDSKEGGAMHSLSASKPGMRERMLSSTSQKFARPVRASRLWAGRRVAPSHCVRFLPLRASACSRAPGAVCAPSMRMTSFVKSANASSRVVCAGLR